MIDMVPSIGSASNTGWVTVGVFSGANVRIKDSVYIACRQQALSIVVTIQEENLQLERFLFFFRF